MVNLLWSILNVALLLAFVYIFWRAALLVKRHIGLAAAMFFGFALLLIGCSKSGSGIAASPSPTANLLTGVPKDAPLANASSVQRITLGGTNKLDLLAEYYTDKGTITKPRGLYATVSGFMVGHSWQPAFGWAEKRGNQLYYSVAVDHHYSLLGVRVFTQAGELFQGLMPPSK
ncbi:hypothetical protein Q3A66_00165 [Hymenobacter sp. BT770]|uniref:hypothetical protein n=1 Tax=Hymenobacter sp. BT770 TaxID=2886942 RepID=UPI001D0FA2B2|nr:hypothetical protein [Hymenobacter sp. BT770]MCC3151917.1 hypothetical protein [Hymenobacter sp. BT770]MDO3413460.1 hypothetical protein [Hymenobacter sp. BT770]